MHDLVFRSRRSVYGAGRLRHWEGGFASSPYSDRVDGLAGYEQMVTALTGDAEWDALVVKGDAAYMDKLNGAKGLFVEGQSHRSIAMRIA